MWKVSTENEAELLKALLGDKLGNFGKFRILTREIYFDPDLPRGADDQVDCPLTYACLSWVNSSENARDTTELSALSLCSPLRDEISSRLFFTILFFQLLRSRAVYETKPMHARHERVEKAIVTLWRDFSENNAAEVKDFLEYVSDLAVPQIYSEQELLKIFGAIRETLDHFLVLSAFPLRAIELEQAHTWIPKREKFVRFDVSEWMIGQFLELRGIDSENYAIETFLREAAPETLLEFFEEALPYPNILDAETAEKFLAPWKSKFLKKARACLSLLADLENQDVRMFVLSLEGEVTDIKNGSSLLLKGKNFEIFEAVAQIQKLNVEELRKKSDSASTGALQTAISGLKKELRRHFNCDLFEFVDGSYTVLKNVRLLLQNARTAEQSPAAKS